MIAYHNHAEREFVDTPYPGVRTCTIWSENDDGAFLTEFKAGARFPMHDHEDTEVNFLLSGRVILGEHDLKPGDLLKIAHGELHAAHAQEDSLLYTVYRGGLLVQG